MRPKRELAENVWYYINTAVNNGEPLFLSEFGVWLLERVLSEAHILFAFELRGVRFAGASVSFFIKPADGFKLPEIMKWIKQTFALRFNWDDGRTGHIWGDRYQSEILPGEPPSDAERYVFNAAVRCANRRARRAQRARGVVGGVEKNAATGQPARGVGVCPRPGSKAENTRLPPGSPRLAAQEPG
jgi:hypothetical protein